MDFFIHQAKQGGRKKKNPGRFETVSSSTQRQETTMSGLQTRGKAEGDPGGQAQINQLSKRREAPDPDEPC